jgi:hypothetical protein
LDKAFGLRVSVQRATGLAIEKSFSGKENAATEAAALG